MSNNIVFSGSLIFLTLADVFQLLGGNNCTGTLTLRSQYSADKGVVHFIDGHPINAVLGKLKGLDAVYALFGWTDGTYDFAEGDLTGVERVIKKSMMEIVLDALRLVDDGGITLVGSGSVSPEAEEAEAGGVKADFLQPIKGPNVDYRYVRIEENYSAGATIVKEGNHGKWLWVIADGTVKIIKETPKGAITLARLGEGCFIGTIRSFLYGAYERSATVIAEDNVQLCLLDAEALNQEYSSLSEDFRKILLSLDNRFRMININAIQAHVGEYSREMPQDKVVENQFHNNTEFYIIREGTADIIGKGIKGDVNLMSLGTDDVFGKIPFMAFGHEPLYASVMTSSPFQADVLDSAALQKEYDNLSHTFRNFVFSTATNISMTTKLFYHLLGHT
ncbi:MAG: hypothetical protein H6Q49_927 [Deltaproteobacteria bacterium]|nr:hypothetical protein [Deltaproteobacteria bacterium]